MITRKLGQLLRGKTTPFEVVAAGVLAAMLGFVPSFAQAPGLVIALIALVFIFNTNLFVVGLVLMVCKTAALALTPVSFYAGRLLLDGPTQGLFETAINAPVLALFGLEFYVVAGGLVIGAVFGFIVGLLLYKLIAAFRKRMAKIETDSQRYGTWAQKRWVKIASWLMFGKKAKLSYSELATRSKLGNPVRPLGVAAAVLIVALAGIVLMFFSGPIVTAAVVGGLERVNGATVDLKSAELDLAGGRMTLHGLAMADPNQLDTNLIQADTVEAKVSTSDLLRKRIALDKVLLTDGQTGAKRAFPGRRIGTPTPPPPPPGEKTLEDYLEQAQRWRDRLHQVRKWLDRMSGPPDEEAEQGRTVDDWLRDQINLRGYRNVKAEHLIKGAPTFLVRELTAEKVRSSRLPEETLDISATHLSTHPHLVEQQPRIRVTSSGETLQSDLQLPVLADGRVGQIDFALSGLSLQGVSQQLKIDGEQLLQGDGTFDTSLVGRFSPADLDLPITFTLHDVLVALPGLEPRPVSELPLTLGLVGPMDRPGIRVDQDQLASALRKAGANELANRAKGEVDSAKEKAKSEAKGAIDRGLRDLLGGKTQEQSPPPETE